MLLEIPTKRLSRKSISKWKVEFTSTSKYSGSKCLSKLPVLTNKIIKNLFAETLDRLSNSKVLKRSLNTSQLLWANSIRESNKSKDGTPSILMKNDLISIIVRRQNHGPTRMVRIHKGFILISFPTIKKNANLTGSSFLKKDILTLKNMFLILPFS